MQNIEFVKSLSGHSGCGLNLYRQDDILFLRKDSGSTSYNMRLKKQYIKQRKFISDEIKVPRVLHCGHENGLFYFDMEFLNGITLSEYMSHIKIKEINSLISLLFKSLPVKNSKILPDTDKIFKKKISQITQQLRPCDTEALDAVAKLEQFDFSNIPFSYCCGDLTLENIILDENKQIYLIDFLDSFYNSWMIDVAKLLQDLELYWSYRYQKIDFNLAMRLAVAKEALLENISEYENADANILSIYHILLLNILRIIPYTRDEHTAKFLKSALNKIMCNINQMENN